MLFNSIEFIFFFLPLTIGIFWLFQKHYKPAAKPLLVIASLIFYGWWNPIYLPLILISATANFIVGRHLTRSCHTRLHTKVSLVIGILLNVSLLGYYKYADFFIANLNHFTAIDFPLLHIVLPLAISFFTFQQISYLVDSYRGEVEETHFISYLLFVCFFPQLIAGPIVHHKQMMPQFAAMNNQSVNYDNFAKGLYIFLIGLCKKIIIADEFAAIASEGFASADSLTTIEAWGTSLAYTLQLYFDFSAYCDMAIGVALFFNIKLPINFNSPYKALTIQDFWRRWHITLSNFLRDYVYISFGGSRGSTGRTLNNLFLTFVIGGIWHGAGWTFIVWGAMHGTALCIHRLWMQSGIQLHRFIAWFITFNFVNVAWVYFRAENINDANNVILAMTGKNGLVVTHELSPYLGWLSQQSFFPEEMPTLSGFSQTEILWIMLFLLVCVFHSNSIEMKDRLTANASSMAFASAIGIWSILNINRVSEFIYFNF